MNKLMNALIIIIEMHDEISAAATNTMHYKK